MDEVKLNKITDYLEEYLAVAEFTDDSWNGLQFEGKSDVKHIATAVDASIDSFSEAARIKADMLIVHHGQFWKQANPSFSSWQKKRLDILFENSLSLYVSHLPLDKHPEVGNNAQLLKLLGAEVTDDFHISNGQSVGWIGKIKETPLTEIVEVLNTKLSAESRVLSFGSKTIRSIGVCSGGAGMQGFFEAIESGVDLYISGDPVYVDTVAKDAGVNVIFAGHYETETVGVRALGDHLAEKYNLEHTFIDLPPTK
jgi:dinuclear metal center YbgI/SA1388 family protein